MAIIGRGQLAWGVSPRGGALPPLAAGSAKARTVTVTLAPFTFELSPPAAP